MYSEKNEKKNEENKFLEIYLSIIENEKIKFNAETVFGLLPKIYCEKIFCIAREWVVLQRFRPKWLGNCIAR